MLNKDAPSETSTARLRSERFEMPVEALPAGATAGDVQPATSVLRTRMRAQRTFGLNGWVMTYSEYGSDEESDADDDDDDDDVGRSEFPPVRNRPLTQQSVSDQSRSASSSITSSASLSSRGVAPSTRSSASFSMAASSEVHDAPLWSGSCSGEDPWVIDGVDLVDHASKTFAHERHYPTPEIDEDGILRHTSFQHLSLHASDEPLGSHLSIPVSYPLPYCNCGNQCVLRFHLAKTRDRQPDHLFSERVRFVGCKRWYFVKGEGFKNFGGCRYLFFLDVPIYHELEKKLAYAMSKENEKRLACRAVIAAGSPCYLRWCSHLVATRERFLSLKALAGARKSPLKRAFGGLREGAIESPTMNSPLTEGNRDVIYVGDSDDEREGMKAKIGSTKITL